MRVLALIQCLVRSMFLHKLLLGSSKLLSQGSEHLGSDLLLELVLGSSKFL